VLGGAPLDGHRHMWWNFVSSRKERIVQAAADWEAMRPEAGMGQVAGETEFIPLPERRFTGLSVAWGRAAATRSVWGP
jgi:Pirin C-terminal cupin domain